MTSKRTKLMSGFVALLMLVSMCAMFVLPASAGENAGGIVAEKGLVDATGYPDITTYSDSVKVYSIKDRAGMEKIATLVNKDGKDLSGVTIYQIADIDMEGTPFGGIGYGDLSKFFSGTFDGNGYTIDNLFVVRTSDTNHKGIALFGSARSAYFKNIGISGGLIVGTNWAGSIAGRAQYCKFSNCWNAATVIGQDTNGTGGIAATNISGSSYMVNCYNVGLIYSGTSKASGIVGWINNPADKVVSCYNAGEIVSGSRSYDPTTAEGHVYAPIVCQSLVDSRGTANANNYFIKGRGGAQKSSYELIKVDGATVIPDTETALNGTHDGTVGLEASALTDGTLAQKLNDGFAAEGTIDGYTIAFENVEGIGYPVLTYRKDGAIVAQRYAKDNTNVNGAKTWEDASPFFAWLKSISNSNGEQLKESVTLTTADDVYLFGALTYGVSLSAYKIAEIKLGADVDIAERASHKNLKYAVPLGVSTHFTGTFDGQNHVIKNWKSGGIGFGANYCAGFIAKTNGTTTVKNLGLINAESYYDAAAAFETAYIYPSLIVERNNGGTLTMENCFATGNLLCDGIVNHNNDSAVFSTTWGDNVKISNCWGNATWSVPGGEKAGVRAIGKLPSAEDYTGDVANCYAFYIDFPTIGSDNAANKYEVCIGVEHPYGTKDAAYWLTKKGGLSQQFKIVDGDIVFATAQDAVYAVAFNKKMNATTTAETFYAYYHPGETVELPAIEGYALVETSLPEGATAAGFAMPAADVAVDYMIQGADYSVAEELVEKYSAFDADILTNGQEVLDLLEVAESIVALKEQEQTAAVVQQAVNSTALLLQLDANFAPQLKNVYPYYPRYSQRALYEGVHDGKNYAIATREDWVAVAETMNKGGVNFEGVALHLTGVIDMKNEAVAPAGTAQNKPFAGTLDGHGYYFENLLIEWATTGTDRWVGLFGFSGGGATIKNLGIESGTVRITKSGTSDEAMVAGFIGEAGGTNYFYNLYNKATIDAGYAYATVSGIARMTSTSVVDGCYNVGDILTVTSKGCHSGGISGYSRADAKIWNSFSAADTIIGATTGATRYNGGNKEALFGNFWSAGYPLDGQQKHANEENFELNYSDYLSGKLAYLLNTNYVAGKGGDRVWYTNDFEAGTVGFGTEATQTRQITIIDENEQAYVLYAAQGDTITLDYPATGNKTFQLVNQMGSLQGDQFTVGNGDAMIVVVYDGVYTAALEDAIAYYREFNTEAYTVSDGRTVKAVIAEAQAKMDSNNITAEEVAAYAALLTADVALTGEVSLDDFIHRNVGEKGFLSPAKDAYANARVAVENKDELATVQAFYPTFIADYTIVLKDDIDLSDGSVNAFYAAATIDGEGHAIRGLKLVNASWYGNGSASMKGLKNLTFDNCSITTKEWNMGLLWAQMTCNDLTLENVSFTNCTFTKNNGANGFGAIVGQVQGGKKLTLKNVTFEGNTINRDCSAQGNNGGLVGPVNGVIVADGVKIINNIYAGTTAKWGDAMLCGELVSAGNVIKNVLIANNKITGSAPNGIISGVHKASATLTVDNVVIVNNQGADNIPVQNGIAAGSPAPVMTNVVTDNNGTVTTAAILNGAELYKLNKTDITKKWVITEDGVDFGTTGLPVKVDFVADGTNNVATLYTDVNGKLVGLTAELLDAATWDEEAALATKVFTEDAVINGIAIPEHNHEWGEPTHIEGTDTHLYTCTWTDGTFTCTATTEGNCIFAPVASEFEGKPEEATHLAECICGNKKTVKCSETEGWTYVKVDAKCEVAGSIDASCDDCGYTYHEDIDALEHAYPATWTHVEGTDTHKKVCANECGKDLVEECAFTGEPVVDEATKEEAGSSTVYCDAGCGNAQVDVLPAIAYLDFTYDEAIAGESVEVNINLNNNRGVSGAQITVTYDHRVFAPADFSVNAEDVLVSRGPAIAFDENLSQVIFTFVFPEEMTEDGTLMTVVLDVAEDAEEGEYSFGVDAEVSDYAMNEYSFEGVSGVIGVTVVPDFILGDINKDGRVSISDAVLMLRVASGDTELNVEELDLVAANVTTDGDTDGMTVNTNDVLLVLQYLNGTVAAL